MCGAEGSISSLTSIQKINRKILLSVWGLLQTQNTPRVMQSQLRNKMGSLKLFRQMISDKVV